MTHLQFYCLNESALVELLKTLQSLKHLTIIFLGTKLTIGASGTWYTYRNHNTLKMWILPVYILFHQKSQLLA